MEAALLELGGAGAEATAAQREAAELLAPEREAVAAYQAAAQVGLGRTVALCSRSSALYQIHEHIRCLDF